ncbi:MAG TPA: SAM-dependent methyltransferase [Vicinamibacterales bacterium]|jgi:methyltransferase (TIGR00027 family)|nr:SAM-dependent methyltransferase [Vicinamibacterales bacterium]
MDQDPLIRDISDTARWMAVYRARETERPDAVFRDPFARALAGERGEQIANAAVFGEENSWSFLARTYLFDRIVTRQVKQGADLVVNLAAGLDTRPYRMEMPPTLRWVEVDLPDILDYKEEILGDAKPVCEVERVRLDLANPDARRGLFDRLGRSAQNVLVISEGLIIYLMPAEVGALAQDLAAPPTFRHWVVDIVSPGLLAMVKDRMGKAMQQAGAPFLFGPPEGPPFFEPYGWKPVDVRSMLKTAAKLERLPFMLRMFAMLPESSGAQGSQPWSGVCLLER